MTPQDFSPRTRAQWLEFQSIKDNAFLPTDKEIEQQRIEQEEARKQIILQKMAARWIIKPSPITKERMLQVMEWLDAKQFLGDDLEWYLDNQLELHWTLEKVMDNLVLAYL